MTSMTSVRGALNSAAMASLMPLAGGEDFVAIREERANDIVTREALLDRALGPQRCSKTSEILRAGRLPARGLALSAVCAGELVGTVRLWNIEASPGLPALLLGPLAVAASHRDLGIGALLMREAIARAQALGHGAILLVGDEPYYKRFGFAADLTHALDLPGPVDRERFLALELKPGALGEARGIVRATGAKAPRAQRQRTGVRRAA